MGSILATLHRKGLVFGVMHYDIYHGYCATMVLALASLIVSSGKFSPNELAYDKKSLIASIRTILSVMNHTYLRGTMLRLAKLCGYILRDLGIDYEGKDEQKEGVAEQARDKGKGSIPNPTSKSAGSTSSSSSSSATANSCSVPETARIPYPTAFAESYD